MPSENAQGVDVICVIVPTEELIQNCKKDLNKIREQMMPEIQLLIQELSDYKRPVRYVFSLEPLDITSSAKVKRDQVRSKLKRLDDRPGISPA
jgi:aspartate/tyrosine/aromatic aminotransferase